MAANQLGVVTGASTGIGMELASWRAQGQAIALAF